MGTPPPKNSGLKRVSPKMYSYHGGLGSTGNDDKSEKSDNSIFWGIVASISGLIVFEIVIPNDGLSFKAQSKNK